MSDAFKFGDFKSKLASVQPQAAPKPEPQPAEQEKVDAVAERRGFGSREPIARVKRERVRNDKVPIEIVSVKGPITVMNRFKTYANEHHSSYWQAIDALLKKVGA